jgi:hypothetical protein
VLKSPCFELVLGSEKLQRDWIQSGSDEHLKFRLEEAGMEAASSFSISTVSSTVMRTRGECAADLVCA